MTTENTSTGAPTIHIYSTPTCHFCKLAKEFFTSHKIAYEEFDVASNIEKRAEMLQKTEDKVKPQQADLIAAAQKKVGEEIKEWTAVVKSSGVKAE